METIVNIIKEEISLEESIKKIDLICKFCHTHPKHINSSIRKIDKTNLSYLSFK